MITLMVGLKQQLGVVVKDVYGNVIYNSLTPNWAFSTSVASVDASGLLTAGTVVGAGDVTASIDVLGQTISGSDTVDVVAGPATTVEVVAVGEPTT